MRQADFNPPQNILPKGVQEAKLIEAIEWSGYPLQGVVATKLQPSFHVTEEWGYRDQQTNEHRTLDVFAFQRFEDGPVCPTVILLIECKRSKHPFVFFQSVTKCPIPAFPRVGGLKRGVVELRETSGARRTIEMDGAAALGLDQLPFVNAVPATCAAFSRAELGNTIKLSGAEIFNGLILPLVTACDYSVENYTSYVEQHRLEPTMILAIGVVDAAMVLVESPEHPRDPILVPWVRVPRHHSIPARNTIATYRHYGIDIVHVDYFSQFLESHLLPFANEFSQRSIRMGPVLARGGRVETLDNWRWDQVEARG